MSAMVCSRPNRPTRLGPMRSWMRLITLRRSQTRIRAISGATSPMTVTPASKATAVASHSGTPAPTRAVMRT